LKISRGVGSFKIKKFPIAYSVQPNEKNFVSGKKFDLAVNSRVYAKIFFMHGTLFKIPLAILGLKIE
jgi:hypothetical protein